MNIYMSLEFPRNITEELEEQKRKSEVCDALEYAEQNDYYNFIDNYPETGICGIDIEKLIDWYRKEVNNE